MHKSTVSERPRHAGRVARSWDIPDKSPYLTLNKWPYSWVFMTNYCFAGAASSRNSRLSKFAFYVR
jgi:hypothetical protein